MLTLSRRLLARPSIRRRLRGTRVQLRVSYTWQGQGRWRSVATAGGSPPPRYGKNHTEADGLTGQLRLSCSKEEFKFLLFRHSVIKASFSRVPGQGTYASLLQPVLPHSSVFWIRDLELTRSDMDINSVAQCRLSCKWTDSPSQCTRRAIVMNTRNMDLALACSFASLISRAWLNLPS